ncbi:twin-arginine translocase TatA/TatE family subunit [Microvirga sp. STR05]|uniref:Sec-independent protein translocase protein TatA n=1 Tax=Hymenobacter duratus TaxID=2771356 RepID=A0ABR8JDZ1_9BACT|nr:twin-arginine translocase TatA/TatE family subunit [Hymenobacter duratus]MBD2713921.1 twin-arginine translocase TatA/TatE family subunit [Hymenobacter duratus]MBR7948823.1 twin-arginine translocase TatA/TatE family subunit [Microvirga sp. STR05]
MQTPLLFIGDIGGSELILILVVILIFFGANKIPELARGLGKGIREFKDASREIRSEFENAGQPQQPYQQQFNQNYVAPAPEAAPQPLPDDAYAPSDAAPVSPGTAYVPPVAPPIDGGITPPVTPSAERPRLDQMS